MTNKHLILRCERQRASKEASSGIRGSRLPASLLNKKTFPSSRTERSDDPGPCRPVDIPAWVPGSRDACLPIFMRTPRNDG